VYTREEVDREGRDVNEDDNGVEFPEEDDNMCEDVNERVLFMGLVLDSNTPRTEAG